MIRLIGEMKDSGEMHMVLCSHLLRDVEETCEEVLILKQGRIVHYSNLEEERSANKRFVEMETFGNDAGFAEALTALGCECATAGYRAVEDGAAGGFRDARDLSAGGGARSAIAAAELSARHAGRHFPEGDGKYENDHGCTHDRASRTGLSAATAEARR